MDLPGSSRASRERSKTLQLRYSTVAVGTCSSSLPAGSGGGAPGATPRTVLPGGCRVRVVPPAGGPGRKRCSGYRWALCLPRVFCLHWAALSLGRAAHRRTPHGVHPSPRAKPTCPRGASRTRKSPPPRSSPRARSPLYLLSSPPPCAPSCAGLAHPVSLALYGPPFPLARAGRPPSGPCLVLIGDWKPPAD